MEEPVSPHSEGPNDLSPISSQNQLLELKWNNFQSILSNELSDLRFHENLVDVTLVTGSQRLFAHKLVLCAASPWFKTLLTENPCNHPIILLNEEYHDHLGNILDFIYSGYAHVSQLNLSEFLQLAQHLQIKGLADASPQQDEQHTNHVKLSATNQNSDQHRSSRNSCSTANNIVDFHELHPEIEINNRTKTLPHRTNSDLDRNNLGMHRTNSDPERNCSVLHKTNSDPENTKSNPVEQRCNNTLQDRINSCKHETNTHTSNSDPHRTNSPPHRSKYKQSNGQLGKIEPIRKRAGSSENCEHNSSAQNSLQHERELVTKKSRVEISNDNTSSIMESSNRNLERSANSAIESNRNLERSKISTIESNRSPEEEYGRDLNRSIDSNQNIEPDPDGEHPYTLLEPKLEILDEQVCYPDYNNDPTDLEQDYYTNNSTHHENNLSPSYNEKHSRARSQQQSNTTSSSNHNSIQDLMNITGRLKEIQPIRTSVYEIPRPSLEPGTSMYNSSRGGCPEGPSQYLSSDYSNLTSSDTSIIPYMNKTPYQHDKDQPNINNLRWEDPRTCTVCHKTYSNNSNYRRHLKYGPACRELQ